MNVVFLLLPCVAISVNVAPKTDFGESTSGISPEIVKSIIEKNLEPTVSPGVVKAVLEVNVGGLATRNKPESKTEGKDDKKKNQVLICTLDGVCKLHEITVANGSKEGGEKTLKPIIVTDFNVDPSKEKGKGEADDKERKDVPDVPVIVGHRGAVRDDHQVDRLPVYYGMKLSPAFHQSYPPPGPIIYEDDSHYPPTHGSYPRYPYGVSYLYSNDEDEYPIEYPAHGNSFPGPSGPRTPTPYGKYYPTTKPVITSLHRRAGGSDWSGTSGVYWPSNQVPQHSGSGWVASNTPAWSRPNTPSLVGPGVHWPSDKPAVVSLHDKMDFDHVSLNGGVDNPSGPGNGEITVDGKLGEPLDKEES